MKPVVVIHAGAGELTPSLRAREKDWLDALHASLGRARALLEGGGSALDAAQAAVAFMEDEADHFNAGRGSVLCSDGSVEMSAALMRGSDRAAGAVAGVTRTRLPSSAARLVLESDEVLIIARRADALAAAGGLEERDPAYFITEHQLDRWREADPARDGGTVGAVCLDSSGVLAAATSTGGVRGQPPGRVGDTPIFGAGTWANGDVAVSCTGKGEAFIRSGVARQIAALVRGGVELDAAGLEALADVTAADGSGGLIAIDARGNAAAPFGTEVMPRGIWRAGSEPRVAIGPVADEPKSAPWKTM